MLVSNVCCVLVVFYLGVGSAMPSSDNRPGVESMQRNVDTVGQISMNGYAAEVHHVVTADGYILEMHRIPRARDTNSSEPGTPVFLMHGLMGSSHAYVGIGRHLSIGYNLADAGFDVWMGNARGTRDSRAHQTLNPDDRQERFQFFDITYEQIGMYDIPAMVDYVLEYTGREKLHYIGHSQGGTVFLVLNSVMPEYNEKFASAHLLAGVGYMEHFPNVALRAVAGSTNTLYSLALRFGFLEIRIPNITLPDWLPFPARSYQCTGDLNLDLVEMCDLIGVREVLGEDDGSGSILMGLGGAAVKQFAHYGQNIQAKLFRRWDFGTNGNLEAYGFPDPPLFDLSLITVNTTMHYSLNDNLLDERDVLAMASAMPNTEVRKIARDSFTHTDYMEAGDTKELVTDFIIDAISSLESESADNAKTETEGNPEDCINSSYTLVPTINLIACAAMIILIKY